MQPILSSLRLFLAFFVICSCLLFNQARAEGIAAATKIADPYIDVRTGPGRGYPIFYVSERGDWIEIIIRKTDWFKIKTPRGVEGWVHKRQLIRTLNSQDDVVELKDPSFDDFSSRIGEVGVMAGDYAGGTIVSAFVGKSLTENLSLELEAGTVIGDEFTSTVYSLSVLNQPFPLWKVSPYALLAVGELTVEKKDTAINDDSGDEKDKLVGVGGGVKIHFSRQFMLRVEYRNSVRLTDNESNREIEEWKAGLAVFF